MLPFFSATHSLNKSLQTNVNKSENLEWRKKLPEYKEKNIKNICS